MRSRMPFRLVRHPSVISFDRFAFAQIRENNTPRPSMAQVWVVAEPSHGNHHVGVGQKPVQINAPALLGRGEIRELATIPGIMNDQRVARHCRTDYAGARDGGRKHGYSVGLDTRIAESLD